jgi:aspartyl-tRNA(Asn)/glutamyl-tRNA(Gln) amidotransferase subunit C
MEIDVRHVARLARIELGEEELRTLEGQISRVLEYIEQLKELDVSKVEPFTHPGDFGNVLREDGARPSMGREPALGNAPDRSADFFAVPRVLEE